ncbi:hypothetical protein BD309DRAFT_231054 [Dichomitus squalens]|nr:hypothetical protein BD309DRAFT_231054 [Dichomitus squalens]
MGTAGLSYSLYLVLASFTSIRVHALLKSLPLCLITFVLSIVPVGVNFVGLLHSRCVTTMLTSLNGQAVFRLEITGQNIPLFGCTEMDNITTNLSQK